MNALFRCTLLLLLAGLYPKQVTGQRLSCQLWRDTVSASVGTTFTNRLTLTNPHKEPLAVSVTVQASRFVQWVLTPQPNLLIEPGQTVTVPLKGLLHQQPYLLIEPVTMYVNDSTGRVLQTVLFHLKAAISKAQPVVSLYAPDETHILYTVTEPARLPLRLVHNHTQHQPFRIDVQSLPAGLDQTPFPKPITLRARQDTTFTLLVNPMRSWSAHTPYQVVVTVRDTTGSIMGSVAYEVVVATDSKRFATPSLSDDDGYGVSAALTKLSTNQWTREARIWGTDSVGNGRLSFRIHYFDYVSGNFQQMQNSYIAWQSSSVNLRIGSQSDYHEMPLLGRGLKVSITRPTRQWTVWAVNANSNLLHPGITDWSGNVVSVRYDQQISRLPGGVWSLSSSYFTRPTGRAGYLNFVSFQFNQPDRHSLNIRAGQSTESGQQGSTQVRNAGWAGQFNYSYLRPAFQWHWQSYVSSPAYAGFQHGATLLNGHAAWLPSERTLLLARFSHLRYNQLRYVSPTDQVRYTFGNTLAEIDLSQRSGPFVLGIRPYWYAQTDFSNSFSQQASAYRLAPSVLYRRSHRQFMFSYDVGLFNNLTAAVTQPTVLSQRITSSVGLGPFSMSGFFQKGPYYLNDLRTERPDRIMTASLTPTVNFDLFNRRLVGSLGLNYLYDALYLKSRYLAVGRIQFDVTPTFWLRLEGNGTPYAQQTEFSYSQYRLELTKRFTQLKLKGNGKLQLRFFEDVNGNGRYDSGEQWAEGLLVTVNDNTLMTSAKGAILYQNIPPGIYTVSAVSSGRLGDPVLYHEKITVARTVNRLIPLRKTFRVNGRLRCQASAYDRKTCEFERFAIEIQRDGQKMASTSPLPDGTFSVHLSPGVYTILVHDYGRQVQATVKITSFTLSLTGEHPVFDWPVDGSTRSVEIKRFKK